MNIALLTNIRAPYRTLQINEYCNIKNSYITVYYTEPNNKNIKWEELNVNFKEVSLEVNKYLNKLGLIFNKGIRGLVKENDIIILGGYQQLSIIYASILCRLYGKSYIIMFDGISTNKLYNKGSIIKRIIKKIVINGSRYIMANGTVGRIYFEENFKYCSNNIRNQYLSVDSNMIEKLYLDKKKLREDYRYKYNISRNEKVVLFSGRLISLKNIETVIKAISKLEKNDITLFITGGGILESELKRLAEELNVKLIITGYIDTQMELFKNYFVADVLILPSKEEAWGLVVNEAMAAGLPVIVSEVCGCSMDLVIESKNGYKINPYDIADVTNKIRKVLYEDNIEELSYNSKKIISKWTHLNSRISLEKIIDEICIR